jgi:hypothetical protein
VNQYAFLRWLRAGAAGAVTGEEAARAERRARFTAAVRVQGLGPDGAVGTIQREVAVHGPGDVVGLDPAQIIRRVPEPGSTTADTGVFAHVELDDPDLPWRYTPFQERATADKTGPVGTLTPWLTLVVVERRPGVSLDYRLGDPLPALTIDGSGPPVVGRAKPDEELPIPGELHAWAHVQIVGDLPADPAALTGLLDAAPDRTLARLVCPRLLAADTVYLACLVPVFAAGRQAGLGEPVTAAADERAWTRGSAAVRLPVYDSWEFSTGPEGDFEALVRRLKRVRLDQLTGPAGAPLVGRRPLDVTSPGFGVPEQPAGTAVDLLGALQLAGDDPLSPLPPAATGLADALEAAVDVDAAVAPPVYGRWHAAAPVPRSGGSWPTWLATLNRHPGLRVAAGLGTRAVQDRQEDFMAAAWDQVGDILRANQLLRQAQLGVAASAALHRRHVQPLGPVARLQLADPALPRLRVTPGQPATLWGQLAGTCLPLITLSGGWRRLLRPRGPLIRRVERWTARTRDVDVYDPAELVVRLAGGDRLGPPPAPGPALLSSAAEIRRASTARPVTALGDMTALTRMLDTLAARAAPGPACDAAPLGDLAATAGDRIDPAVTIPRRARAQLKLPAALWDPPERIDPIMVAPQITAPMYGVLAALGQDWLLPGLEHLPPDSVSAVAANQAFVEAFLVGMNHEMGRELLWRGYPTDQRCTVFRQFWDEQGAATPPAGDIVTIGTWPPASELGSHPARAGRASDQFVLVLRGELIRRFPRATVLLVQATLDPNGTPTPQPIDDTTAFLPIFSGRMDPDVLFLGFDKSAADVHGATPPTRQNPGWFVVLQEQPTEPRFGVSAAAGARVPPETGRYLSWADLGASDLATVTARMVGGRPVGYVDLAATTTMDFLKRIPQAGPLPAWDGRSDTLAAIFLRRPFRLCLHGSGLIPAPPGPVPP